MVEEGSFTKIGISCPCGTELLFHCRARTGMILGRKFGACPDCGAEHRTPDDVLRTFRREGDDWREVEAVP